MAKEAAEATEAPRACLVLVCGLPGSGKTSFSRELVAQGGLGAEWLHVCYDEVEHAMRADRDKFDPEQWRQARVEVARRVRSMLEAPSEESRVIVLDDNMYYRSMRKQWYHLCREISCAYHQLFLQAPEEVCLERNRLRDAHAKVPEFSIRHMAEVFEWPPEAGGTWEAQEGISTLIDSSLTSAEQVVSCLDAWQGHDFWRPVPVMPEAVEDVQSDSHHCDVALRKIVSRALADVPKEHSQLKSALAKKWGAKKAEMSKNVAAANTQGLLLLHFARCCVMLNSLHCTGASASDLIHEAEVSFLQSCISDLQQALQTGPMHDS